jgi:hypothetical protein
MVDKAEKYKGNGFDLTSLYYNTDFFHSSAEAEAAAAHITSKNTLQSYAYTLRNSLTDEKLADKFEPADRPSWKALLTIPSNGSMPFERGIWGEAEAIAKYVFFLILESWHVTHKLLCSRPIMQRLYG